MVEITTIKVTKETRDRLNELKETLNISDYEGVVSHLIDTVKPKSGDDYVYLELTGGKFKWLMAQQNKYDCRECLEKARQ